MVKEITDLSKNDFAKLERSLNKLTAKLAEQVTYLEKHAGAVESLTQAIQHLDTTIKKEISLESRQPSMQLKEAITAFVEYAINPKFYQDLGLLKLNAAPDKMHGELVPRTKHHSQS